MSDEFKMTTGQAHEMALAFGRNGWNNAEVKKLSEGDMLARLLPVVRGQAEVKPMSFPSLVSACDLIPHGWTIVEDVAPTLKSASDLEIVPFLESGESVINSETMRERAKKLNANLGLADLKVVLDDKGNIPTKMKPYYIVFSGTKLRDSHGYLHVAYLYWSGGRWCLHFDWLDYDWSGDDRLARCK